MWIFILGVLTGLLISLILILLHSYALKKSDEEMLKKMSINLDEIDEDVRDIIYEAKKKVLRLDNIGFLKNYNNLKTTSLDMAIKISKQYNPNSERPELELTLIEILEINKKISNYLIEQLNKSYFKPLRNITVAQILKLVENKHSLIKAGNKMNKFLEWKKYIEMCIDPLTRTVKTAAITISLEGLYKSLGNIGIEKLGKELNIVYSREYYDKKIKNTEKVWYNN